MEPAAATTAELKAGQAATTTGARIHTALIVNGWTTCVRKCHASSERDDESQRLRGPGGLAGAPTQNSIRRRSPSAIVIRGTLALRARPSAQLRRRLICSSIVLASGR